MSKETQCTKILLSKNQAGRVGYCESCEVVELGIGAVSIRITAQDLSILTELLKEANRNMAYYDLVKKFEHTSVLDSRSTH